MIQLTRRDRATHDVLTSTILALQQFHASILPALSDHWLRDSLAVLFLETSLPNPGASGSPLACGAAALSAFAGLPAVKELTSLQKRGLSGWVNRREMEASLQELGLKFLRSDGTLPKCGLSIIQWEGPWLKKTFRGSNLAYTHWVAVVGDYVFDVMWGGWLPQSVWKETVVEDIIKSRQLQGWHVLSSYELRFQDLMHP